MGIVATDILIKTMLEAAIADMRKNVWIVEDVFGMLSHDFLASKDYGQKEVEAAVRWFTETEIPVLMAYRIADLPPVPCIVVSYNEVNEALDRASLADQRMVSSMDPTSLISNARNITATFSVSSYDQATGEVIVPDTISLNNIRPGQFLVAGKSGKAYVIYEITGDKTFRIKEGLVENFTKSHIRSKFGVWNLEQEITFMNESYTIACHANGNAGCAQWLWQIVMYCLLRYKESYLEGRLFELSSVRSSPLQRNNSFGADTVHSRYITLNGVVPATWIKYAAPKLEVITGQVTICDGPNAPVSPGRWDGYQPKKDWLEEPSPNAPIWQVSSDFPALGEDDSQTDPYHVISGDDE